MTNNCLSPTSQACSTIFRTSCKSLLKKRRWQDRQASLYGRLLVAKGLEVLGYPKSVLSTYETDTYDRPFFTNGPSFNFSHTSEFIICAVAISGKFGIDIEFHQPVDIADYRRVFTLEEWKRIHRAAKPLLAFYEQWTKKEAVMKADGRGFQLPPASFEILGEATTIDNKTWRAQRLNVPAGYTAYLVADQLVEIDQHTLSVVDLKGLWH